MNFIIIVSFVHYCGYIIFSQFTNKNRQRFNIKIKHFFAASFMKIFIVSHNQKLNKITFLISMGYLPWVFYINKFFKQVWKYINVFLLCIIFKKKNVLNLTKVQKCSAK